MQKAHIHISRIKKSKYPNHQYNSTAPKTSNQHITEQNLSTEFTKQIKQTMKKRKKKKGKYPIQQTHYAIKKLHTQIDLPLGFVPQTLVHQNLPLGLREGVPLNSLPHRLPLLLQLWVLRSLHRPRLGVHGRGAHPCPFTVEAAWPERRVLGLSEPNRPHCRAALRVTVLEIEGQLGAYRLLASPIKRRRRAVLGFLLFLGLRIRVLGGWGEGGWGFEGVVLVEF